MHTIVCLRPQNEFKAHAEEVIKWCECHIGYQVKPDPTWRKRSYEWWACGNGWRIKFGTKWVENHFQGVYSASFTNTSDAVAFALNFKE